MVFVVFIVTAASFEGYFAKWNFLDYWPSELHALSIIKETAIRPHVYRQLIPATARKISNTLSEKQREKLQHSLEKHNFLSNRFRKTQIPSEYIIEYYSIYTMTFICFFLSTFVWIKICTEITGDKIAGFLGALLFNLLVPLLETGGGYFYDFSEILFFSLATLFAYNGRWIPLILITPFATANKESFLFFILTLYPIFRRTQTAKISRRIILWTALISEIVYLKIISFYTSNLGVNVWLQLYDTIKYNFPLLFLFLAYFIHRKFSNNFKGNCFFTIVILITGIFCFQHTELAKLYFSFIYSTDEFSSYTYSVVMGERLFFPHILIIFWLVKSTWHELPVIWQRHALTAFMINIPLYLLFCAPGELRNLSMLYPSFILMLSFYINSIIKTIVTDLQC